MQSHTELHLDNIRSEGFKQREQHSGNSSADCEWSEYELSNGKIMVRSISSFFAFIEMIEYSVTKEVTIEFSVIEPTFYMSVNLKSADTLLCYRPTGRYRMTLSAGSNTIMLITLRTDWFLYKCKNIPEFRHLVLPFYRGESKKVNLCSVSIGASLFKAFKTFQSKSKKLDDGYLFVNGCIEKYYNNIKARNNTLLYHNETAVKIAQYVAEYFKTDRVDNISDLLETFRLSERNFARLAKLAFGRPFHEEIIKLRMEYAMDLLLTTDLPIKKIAILSGYKDSHYFSKAFKKYVGENPKTLKTSHINPNLYEMQN